MRLARTFLLAIALIAATHCCTHALRSPPQDTVLCAPYTPFNKNATAIETSVIPAYAKHCHEYGVNLVWVAGGMGEYSRLSSNEKKELFHAWASVAPKYDIYTVMHVGSQDQLESIALAKYVEEHIPAADAIASLPPFSFAKAGSLDALVTWLAGIAAAAPSKAFFYYHIPGETTINLDIVAFVQLCQQRIPTFGGVKYVDSSDLGGYFTAQRTFAPKSLLMWAPEPKLTGLALGSTGFVMAESFYGPTFLRMRDAFREGNMTSAHNEQEWKFQAGGISGRYGLSSGKAVTRMLGVPINVSVRPPFSAVDDDEYDEVKKDLDAIGFFDQPLPSKERERHLSAGDM